jgi:hypothetical protein
LNVTTEDIIERALLRAGYEVAAEKIQVSSQDEGDGDIFEVPADAFSGHPDVKKIFLELSDEFGHRLYGVQVRPSSMGLDIYIESALIDDEG